MRKVMVSEYTYRLPPGGHYQVRSVQEKGVALFHAIGTEYEELDRGIGLYPCAVVEWPDGTIESVPLKLIRFIDPEVPSA